MKSISLAYSLAHLSDSAIDNGLVSSVTDDWTTTARLLAFLGESDARDRYLCKGYPSMHAYCVGEFHMTEDVACKRIAVARAARQFPAIFDAVAAGKLGLTSILMLARHLTPDSADRWLAAAAGRTNAELRLLLVGFDPKPDLPTLVAVVPAAAADHEPAVRRVGPSDCQQNATLLEPPTPRPKLAPLSPGRFGVQVTLTQEEYDDLCRAQELLSHAVPSKDAARVIGRALRALVAVLEKKKFAGTDKPRASRGSANPRTIPAHVRRTVAERDGGRCTFVGENDKRCDERSRLEFDHVVPVARGGESTVDGVRLRCRAHNQFEAERVFGESFMKGKREEAKQRMEQARAEAAAEAANQAAEKATVEEVVPYLQVLGLKAGEARRAAACCAHMTHASIEDKLRVVLPTLAPKSARKFSPATGTWQPLQP